ncbi:glycosyltransferase family 4 protein [Yoonia sp. SDW83-1]|uniref:glycosyltransferase family 4 protein n=1 Tax=Yoonia sp. SDW83-1 TaxID=3366945 RepID=UPI00398C2FF1
MRIGLVTPAWPGGKHANGITTTVVYLVEGLEALGHEVTVIPLSPDSDEDPRCIPLPENRRPTLQERATAAFGLGEPMHQRFAERIVGAARTAIDTRSIEVLVMEETQGWAGIVQQMLPIPVIVTLHGPWFIQTSLQSQPVSKSERRREQREARAFRECAGLTAPSQHVLDMTRAQIADLTSKQSVIHNPIRVKDPVDYDRLNNQQRKSILFVGRHDLRKGADILLQGFADLIAGGADAYLTFVGPDSGVTQADGSIRMFPKALAALNSDARGRITFLGSQSKEQIDSLRQQHAIAVVTSRYETFGYVVLEALAAGAATISTAAGGPTEIIRHQKNGLLIPVDDAQALTEAMQKLLSERVLAAQLGRAGREDVAARFAPREIAGQLVTFAQDVVAGFRPPKP